jgi:hypothetical protein
MRDNTKAKERRSIQDVQALNRMTRDVVRQIRSLNVAQLAGAIFKLMENHGYKGIVKYDDCYRFAKFAEKMRIAAAGRKSKKSGKS